MSERPTEGPADAGAESMDAAEQIGERPPPDSPAAGVVDETEDDPPEAAEPG